MRRCRKRWTAIEDATADKPYVIKIAPGIYTETSNGRVERLC